MTANQVIYEPDVDITCREAKTIIKHCRTTMEVVELTYALGYARGKEKKARNVTIFNIPMMSDEEWNILAAQNAAERQAMANG